MLTLVFNANLNDLIYCSSKRKQSTMQNPYGKWFSGKISELLIISEEYKQKLPRSQSPEVPLFGDITP